MASCEALVPGFTVVNNVLTNNSTLQVNNTRTAVGEVVKLSCLNDFTLQAESDVVKCLPTGKWSFSTKPTCVAPEVALTEEQKIILGVAGGVGGLVFIILIIMVCLIVRAKRHNNKKSKQRAVSSTETPRADILNDPIDTYPQRYPYPDPYDITSRDIKPGYGNPAYLYDDRRDFVDPRKDYLRDMERNRRYDNNLPVRHELDIVSPNRRHPASDPSEYQRYEIPHRQHRRNAWRTRRYRRYTESVSSGYTESLDERDVPRKPHRYRRREGTPRRYRPNRWRTHEDRSFGGRLPSADYDDEYFSEYPDDPLPDPAEFRSNPDLLRADPEGKPYRLTSAVRMYEEYGRPARVRMLEEAYNLQRPYRRPSENFKYGLKAVTSRSAEVYGLRGDDPTRFYRGFYH